MSHRRTARLVLALSAALATSASPCLAKEGSREKVLQFTEDGAKPGRYRLSALSPGFGAGTSLQVAVWKQGLATFGTDQWSDNLTRSDMLVHQDGKLWMAATLDEGPTDRFLVGDASDLDDIRMLAGVRCTGYEVHRSLQPNSVSYQFSADEGVTLAPATGQVVGVPFVVDLLIAAATGGAPVPEGTTRVGLRLVDTLFDRLPSWSPGNAPSPEDFLYGEIRAAYVDRMNVAVAAADPAHKAGLRALNAAASAGVRRNLALMQKKVERDSMGYYRRAQAVLLRVQADLAQLQPSLE